MEKVRWRGTWGVGDFMNALNVCHNYCWVNNIKVNLEMHWEHGEDYLHSPDDPETIIERMEWIHSQYHRQDDVVVTHVYNSHLFEHGNMNGNKSKHRFYFDSNAFEPNTAPLNDWIFKPEAFVPKKKKVVIWTPTYNTEQPRTWKRFLTKDDWSSIISSVSWEGWILVELTYRTPVRDAFKQIQEADFIVCYDGMWHFIARNFGKPMFIPSWEGITGYNTPQAIRRPLIDIRKYTDNPSKAISIGRKDVLDFFKEENFESNMGLMKDEGKRYIHRMKKRFYED